MQKTPVPSNHCHDSIGISVSFPRESLTQTAHALGPHIERRARRAYFHVACSVSCFDTDTCMIYIRPPPPRFITAGHLRFEHGG